VQVCGAPGDRRPSEDVDLVVMPGKLPDVVKMLQQQQKAFSSMASILWRGIAFRRPDCPATIVYPFARCGDDRAAAPDVAAWRLRWCSRLKMRCTSY
jgi:hypothetical protein